jgi:hypothetical protein
LLVTSPSQLSLADLKTALHQTPEKAREVEQVEYLAKIIMVCQYLTMNNLA